MKNLLFGLLTVGTLLGISAASFAQKQHDIGLGISSMKDQQFQLEYRRAIKELWKFRTGLLYGFETNFLTPGNSIYSASDSVVQFRNNQYDTYMGGLKLGVERQLKWPVFSISTDLILGYKYHSRFIGTTTYTKEDDDWIFNLMPSDYGGEYYKDHATSIAHYGRIGFVVGGNLNLPIGSKFLLNTFLNMSYFGDFFLAETAKMDPFGEIGNPDYMARIGAAGGIGVKYLLNSKK
jgi:hypothetical protein